MAGLDLDAWQELVLEHGLAERADGKWAAFEVGLVVPRQNGKGSILEARSLAGLFLLGERLIIHSAHQFDTSLEAFRRLLSLLERTPDLERRISRVRNSHGEEGIELKNGQRIRFRTRTKGGGRGFTGDCLLLDEAMVLPESSHAALLPTLSARPNPQVWYTGSAVDQKVHEHGLVLARVRERALRGDDPALAYIEWSAYAELDTVENIAGDVDQWAAANPGLGIRISAAHVERERRSMDPRTFAVERLGVGDWPRLDQLAGQGISYEAWDALTDPNSTLSDPVCFAFDVRPDRSAAAISVAGQRADGLEHTEVIEHRRGTDWVGARLTELLAAHRNRGVVADLTGPAGSLIADLERRHIQVEAVSSKEHAQACGLLYDAVAQQTIRHLGTPELTAAIKGAVKRPLGDAWAWSRKSSAVDISPLVACTLAHWRASTGTDSAPFVFEVFG